MTCTCLLYTSTIDNIVGLCTQHHDLVHKDATWQKRLAKKKTGLNKKYGALSVLNQDVYKRQVIVRVLRKEILNVAMADNDILVEILDFAVGVLVRHDLFMIFKELEDVYKRQVGDTQAHDGLPCPGRQIACARRIFDRQRT